MAGGLRFDREWEFAPPNSRQQFLASLNRTFGPAMLLGFKTIHVDGQFSRRHHVGQKNKFPSGHLRAVTEIEVFTQSIVLPAAGFLNTGFPPQPGGSVKIEKTSAPAAGCLLKQQVTVQKHRLHPGKHGIPAVEMAPSRLDHANLRVGEKLDGLLEKFWRSDEIRVENTHELAAG